MATEDSACVCAAVLAFDQLEGDKVPDAQHLEVLCLVILLTAGHVGLEAHDVIAGEPVDCVERVPQVDLLVEALNFLLAGARQ